jgi:hypothetical protein
MEALFEEDVKIYNVEGRSELTSPEILGKEGFNRHASEAVRERNQSDDS